MINIEIAQINPIVGDLPYNLQKIQGSWDAAAPETDLIIFPEMAICGYPPEDLILKPFFMKQIMKNVVTLVNNSKNCDCAILLSTPWSQGGHIYNAVHLIAHGDIIATRMKHHLPNYGVFDEQRIFTPGALPDPIDFKGLKLGVMVCEDMWHKDVASHLAAQGADILITPNASPYEADKKQERRDIARARVNETGLPLIYVNQVGGQDELVFDGSSFIMNADLSLTANAAQFKEDTISATFTKTQSGQWSAASTDITKPYNDLEAIYQALILGLRDYINKNNFPGVLLGLSGGIDSALSAIIATDALGPDKVHCVMMPSKYTSDDSRKDASAQAQILGLKLDTIPIEPAVSAFNDILAPHFSDKTNDITFENIQPRTRGLILMALSNASGHMVLSTGNKSEMAVGYATLYGDMCGGFNVLKDIYKTQAYDLANWRNQNVPSGALGGNGEVIPARVITKAPTAELKDNQTDQDTLPEYSELDKILKHLIEEDLSINEITKLGHTPETVERIWKMLDRAEYKRRQAAPGVKITSRAFGRDRRYPITNHFVNIIEK